MTTICRIASCVALALVSASAADARSRAIGTAHRTYGRWRSGVIGGGGYLQQVAFAPSDPKRLYLVTDVGGLFRSDDGGGTWRMLHGALPADAGSYEMRGVLVHPRDADRILACCGSAWGAVKGVFLSTDGGRSFRQTLKAEFRGNGHARNYGWVIVGDPRDARVVLVGAMDTGIHRSTDGGSTWMECGPSGVFPCDIDFDAANPDRVWMCATREGSRAAGFFESLDNGRTWRHVAARVPSEICQMPALPASLFGVMRREQIVRSLDYGRTWHRYSEGLAPWPEREGARVDGIFEALEAGRDFLVAGAHSGQFYVLEAGASSWRRVVRGTVDEGTWWGRMRPGMYQHYGSALGYVGVSPHDPDRWVFTDWYALYRTTDGGRDWTLSIDGIEMTVVHCVAQDPFDRALVHVGVADVGYRRSTDGGKTYAWSSEGISNNIKCISASPARRGRAYAVGPKQWHWHANQVFATDDAGRTWRRSPMRGLPDTNRDEYRCNTIVAHPARGDEVYTAMSGTVVEGRGGIYRSVDGGTSWEWAGHGLPEGDSLFRKDIWVAGPELGVSRDGSMVAASIDRRKLFRRGPDGGRWHAVDIPNAAPNCVAADPSADGRFYAALQDAGLWRTDDGGRTWKNVIGRYCSYVAVDVRRPGRVAANCRDRFVLSVDGGASWKELDAALPYRHMRNVAAFTGDRLVVGTGGNGVFWTDVRAVGGRSRDLSR